MTRWVGLHLGAHKTASTHVQRVLTRNRAALAAAGIGYAGPSDLRVPDRPFKTAHGLHPEGAREEDRQAALATLAQGAARLILSEENLMGLKLNTGADPTPYPNARWRVRRMVEAVAPTPAHLFLAVRDPAGWMASVYRQDLIEGVQQDFAAFRAGRGPWQVRWSDLVGRLASLPGLEGVTVWRFEDYARQPARVLAALTGAVPGLHIETEIVHQGLSAPAVEAVLRLPKTAGYRDAARDLRARLAVADGHAPFQPWTAAEAQRSADAYAEDLARIAALPGVRLLRPEG